MPANGLRTTKVNYNRKTMSLNTEMFWTFAKIGTFTLGGGFAMVPLMESGIVDKKRWLTKEEFLDVIIVSQSSPGVFAVNMASHVGYKIGGKWGGVVGSLGVVMPSLVIILLIAMFFQQFKSIRWVEKIFMGIRPAVVALIAAPVFTMAKSAKLNKHNFWIPIVAALLIKCLGVSPIYIIIVPALAGFVYGRYKHKQAKQDNQQLKD